MLSIYPAKKLAKDPVFIAAESIVSMYNGYFAIMSDADNMREKGMNLYVNGLRAMNPDKNYYPDANSTLRLTYGEIVITSYSIHYTKLYEQRCFAKL